MPYGFYEIYSNKMDNLQLSTSYIVILIKSFFVNSLNFGGSFASTKNLTFSS